MVNSRHKIFINIASSLKKQGDTIFIKKVSRLFKNEISLYGVKMVKVREIIKNFYRRTPALKNRRICINVADELIKTEIFENQIAGIFLLKTLVKKNEFQNISYLKQLIINYVKNWAACDTISTDVIAEIVKRHPNKIYNLLKWNKSKNTLVRRSLLVTIIKLKNDIKKWNTITNKLLYCFKKEKEDIVKKAIKWLKREKFSLCSSL